MSESSDEGKEKSFLVRAPNALIQQVDIAVVPIIRQSGSKLSRASLIRCLLELACSSANFLDTKNITSEETLRKELLSAIAQLHKTHNSDS